MKTSSVIMAMAAGAALTAGAAAAAKGMNKNSVRSRANKAVKAMEHMTDKL